jgi:ArsR family transcriptional regulator
LQDSDLAALCRALGDEKRIAVLRMLADGERCACELLSELDISQPTLSHHMKLLCDTGLVAVRREGRWRHYRLLPEAIETLRQALSGLCKAPEASALSCSCGKKPC